MSGTIYELSTLGTTNNKITFNDFNYLYQTGVLYRARKRAITAHEIREFDIPLPEADGIADYQTFLGKTTFVIEGTMYPNDETYYDLGRDALHKLGSLTVEQADGGSDMGYVPYTWTQSNGSRVLNVKVLHIDTPENVNQGLVQPFRIICKVKSPFALGAAISAIIGSSSATTSSGSGYPFLYPVLYGSTVYSSTGSLVSNGQVPSYPTITITGPINKPKLTNVTTGEYIEVDVNLATVSDTLLIGYDQDTAPTVTVAGNSVYNKVTSASTFFLLKPGAISFTLTGTSVGSGVSATISTQPLYAI